MLQALPAKTIGIKTGSKLEITLAVSPPYETVRQTMARTVASGTGNIIPAILGETIFLKEKHHL
ncbi:MAG: hypothetical protein ORN57_00485 [Alphaproteobacteria bacterium]|nr:hypothetical protein [Alphaproteobacteria bacterium]